MKRLSLPQLHNNIIQQISSMEGKFGIISVLNAYNDELVKRNERLLSQHVSSLISEVRNKNVDGRWVISKIQGIINQQHSQAEFQKQQQVEFMNHSLTERGFASSKNMSSLQNKVTSQSFVINSKKWSSMNNFNVLDQVINSFRTTDDFNLISHGLEELRHHLSETLPQNKMRILSAFINDMKLSKSYDSAELISMLRTIQDNYR